MNLEQLTALLTAIGTIGGPVVAVVAIVASNRTNRATIAASEKAVALAREQIDLQKNERASALRTALFEQRAELLSRMSLSLNQAWEAAKVYRDALSEFRAKPTPASQNRAAHAQQSLFALQVKTSDDFMTAGGLLTEELLDVFLTANKNLYLIGASTDETKVTELYDSLRPVAVSLIENSRAMFHVDALGPQIVDAIVQGRSSLPASPIRRLIDKHGELSDD